MYGPLSLYRWKPREGFTPQERGNPTQGFHLQNESVGAILHFHSSYCWSADRWYLFSILWFFSKTAIFTKLILISKLFKSTSGNDLPFFDMVNCYQMWIWIVLKLELIFVNVAVLEKITKLKLAITYQHITNNLKENTRLAQNRVVQTISFYM